jgi:hypothetical protein
MDRVVVAFDGYRRGASGVVKAAREFYYRTWIIHRVAHRGSSSIESGLCKMHSTSWIGCSFLFLGSSRGRWAPRRRSKEPSFTGSLPHNVASSPEDV